MNNKSNKLANIFAELICLDLKIIDAVEYLRTEAIDALQGEYGTYEDGFGTEEYSFLNIYSDGKFDWWFDKNLTESQKDKLLEFSEDSEHFKIDFSSHRRQNIIFQFLAKLKRTEVEENIFLNIFIDFSNIDSEKYKIYAKVLGQISDDEISKMLMMYQLKR